MKNINSLIDLKEYDKAKTLVYALSGYISHAFSDIKGFVPIREELQAIQSYVDLCQALGNQIQLDFKLSGQCMDMDCLPTSLLTFVENSIKHAKNGSSLQLSISVEAVVEQDGQKKGAFPASRFRGRLSGAHTSGNGSAGPKQNRVPPHTGGNCQRAFPAVLEVWRNRLAAPAQRRGQRRGGNCHTLRAKLRKEPL